MHAVHKQSLAFMYRKPPEHYLGYVVGNKKPIVLIPGLFEKWHFLKAIADPLSLQGHPIYVPEHIGYNTKEIHNGAQLVHEFIEENDLNGVIIIAHSKGGLIGKHILAFHNQDERVAKVIAIATPFQGSYIAKLVPHKIAKEFTPNSKIIQILSEQKDVNQQIVAICGIFDNSIWPSSNCHLEGAKNIQVNVHGHHTILFDKNTRKIVLDEVEKI